MVKTSALIGALIISPRIGASAAAKKATKATKAKTKTPTSLATSKAAPAGSSDTMAGGHNMAAGATFDPSSVVSIAFSYVPDTSGGGLAGSFPERRPMAAVGADRVAGAGP